MVVEAVRSELPRKTGQQIGELIGASKQWLRDHVIASAALFITLVTAAGYCVHRSWLFGWYQAAGIPAFSHGWSVQDVVMLGVLNLEVWGFGLLAVTFVTVAVYLTIVFNNFIDKEIDAWLDRKGYEVIKEAERTPLRRRLRRVLVHLGLCVWFATTMALVLLVIAFATWLLSSKPRSLGKEQFTELQAKAQSSFEQANASLSREALEHLTERHAYVQVKIGFDGADARMSCGWLVLQNGEHLLLLSREGPLFISATGLGFTWKKVAFGTC